MPANNVEPSAPETAQTARERFGKGPMPAWATACAYQEGFKAKAGAPVTHLLLSRQIHAEEHQSCVQSAIRLETMEAVQHESQWRLQFEPRTQTICLHWVRIRRGTQVFDHTQPERCRVLQREEALEGFVVDGCYTLLLLLEDVRPGDILESAYTVTTQPRLLAGNCWSFFGLPPHVPVANFHHSLRFNSPRAMRWKTSSEDLKLEVRTEDAQTIWAWSGADYTGSPAEANTPDWHIDHPWVQISDCPDWNSVAKGFAEVWREQPDNPELAAIVEKIQAEETELMPRIERAIRLIQDEFRYLSVDLEMGGHVPAPPATVARRRYGDCKDLSFLLVHLLRRLGVPARPILVNTRLQKSIMDKLPMPGLFDHVVVEFQMPEGPRWVDPTLRSQGGGSLNRVIPDYGAGLPVDAQASELVNAPTAAREKSAFELKESLLMDTRGGPSLLAIVVRATGSYAENLRQQFECCALEEIARERLEACRQRFGNVDRQGQLQYRDDRSTNEFWLAEMFDIPTSLLPVGQMPESIRFSLPSNIILSSFQLPENTPRRTPLALPYPCNLTHTVELYSPGITLLSTQRQQLGNAHLRFMRSHKTMAGFWSITLQVSTLENAVPVDKILEHRKMLQEIGRESAWEVVIATGYARLRQRADFGVLPPPPRKPGHAFTPTAPTVPLKPKSSTGTLPAKPGFATHAQQRPRKTGARHPSISYKDEVRQFRRRQKMTRVTWVVTLLLIVAGLVVVFIFAAKH